MSLNFVVLYLAKKGWDFWGAMEEAKILRPNLCQPKGSGCSWKLVVDGGDSWGIKFSIHCPHSACLCSSGDRKGPRSHLDSGDTFAGAEPPARSAAPCGEEDTPRGFFSCLCHHDGPREGPWTLRNGRITRTKHHDPSHPSSSSTNGSEWSCCFIGEAKVDHTWTYKVMNWPQSKMTMWLKKGFKKGFIKHWWRSPRKNVKFPFLEVSKCKRFSINVRNYKFSTITSSPCQLSSFLTSVSIQPTAYIELYSCLLALFSQVNSKFF